MMKLKAGHVWEATQMVAQIIRAGRPMPQKGKYRLARMHAKLMPEFTIINDQRDALIRSYEFHAKVNGPSTREDPLGQDIIDSPEFTVPANKLEEFSAAWAKIAEEEIEVDVQPIPLAQLDLGDDTNGSVEASELAVLGTLVEE